MSPPAPVDHGAFASLVTAHQHRLFALVLMMVRDPAAADDVTQEAFIRAWRRVDRYDPRRPFYPWVATIAVRLAQNWLRKRAGTAAREGTGLDDAPAPAVPAGALDALVTGERDRRLWNVVSALPSGERTVVYLYYRQDMTVTDIARALDVASGTVKTLLFRARQKLRTRLAPEVPR